MQPQFHLIRLSPTRLAFYDPVFNVNLTTVNPQAPIPAGVPLSGSILAALKSGGIIDVNGTIMKQMQGDPADAEIFRRGSADYRSETEQTNSETPRMVDEAESIEEITESDSEAPVEDIEEEKPKRPRRTKKQV